MNSKKGFIGITAAIALAFAAIILIFMLIGTGISGAVKQDLISDERLQSVHTADSYNNSLIKYSSLDSESKKIYDSVLTSAVSFDEFSYDGEAASLENILQNYVLADFPEIFWCDGTAEIRDGTARLGFTMSEAEAEQYSKEINSDIDELIKSAESEEFGSEYDKAVWCFNRICREIEKDNTAKGNLIETLRFGGLYDAVMNKKADALGYAKLYQCLALKLELSCTAVFGTLEKDEKPHYKNLVIADGKAFYVDSYFGDSASGILYEYLGETSEESANGFDEKSIDGCELQCENNDCSYLVRNGYYLESATLEGIKEVFRKCFENNMRPIQIKFADTETLQSTRALLESDATLSKLIQETGSGRLKGASYDVHMLNSDDEDTTLYIQY